MIKLLTSFLILSVALLLVSVDQVRAGKEGQFVNAYTGLGAFQNDELRDTFGNKLLIGIGFGYNELDKLILEFNAEFQIAGSDGEFNLGEFYTLQLLGSANYPLVRKKNKYFVFVGAGLGYSDRIHRTAGPIEDGKEYAVHDTSIPFLVKLDVGFDMVPSLQLVYSLNLTHHLLFGGDRDEGDMGNTGGFNMHIGFRFLLPKE